jgi:hypothetical protein
MLVWESKMPSVEAWKKAFWKEKEEVGGQVKEKSPSS